MDKTVNKFRAGNNRPDEKTFIFSDCVNFWGRKNEIEEKLN
jgi:hypothetical protein